jgi:hypothetical protein
VQKESGDSGLKTGGKSTHPTVQCTVQKKQGNAGKKENYHHMSFLKKVHQPRTQFPAL